MAETARKSGKGPGPFMPEMCWETWWERFGFFIQLKGVTDMPTKRLLLFTEMGQIYEELRRMAQPEDVRTMTLTEIERLMSDRFGETKSIWAQRHELFSAKQQSGQSIRDYAVDLRSLIAKAEWSRDSIDMCLCALFINGIQNDAIRVELIRKGDKDLKFKDAVESAVLLEQSNLDAQVIGSNATAEVAKVVTQNRGQRTPNKSTGNCFRCGKPGHFSNVCPNKDTTCNKCGKRGHWAVVCRSKDNDGNAKFGSKYGQKGKEFGRNVKNVERAKISGVKEIKGVIANPIFIQLKVHTGKVNFELDSGADVSVINEIDWKRIGSPKLEPSQGLVAYGGDPIDGIIGKTKVDVAHEGRTMASKIHVIGGEHKNLCGRDLIIGLQIDLNRAFGIKSIHSLENKKELKNNPKSNGAAERFVQTFKQGMNKLRKDGMKLEIALSQFLLKYRITPHPATDQSPSESLLNRRLRTLLDLVKPTTIKHEKSANTNNKSYVERMKRNFDRGTNAKKKFGINQKVFARNFRDGSKWIPGQIIQKIGSAMFLVRTERGLWRRHFDQLKENLTDQNFDDFESEEESPIDQEDNDNIDIPPSPNQPAPNRSPATDGPRRSTRVRKPRKMFDPSG